VRVARHGHEVITVRMMEVISMWSWQMLSFNETCNKIMHLLSMSHRRPCEQKPEICGAYGLVNPLAISSTYASTSWVCIQTHP
jgi:hypothetical protein